MENHGVETTDFGFLAELTQRMLDAENRSKELEEAARFGRAILADLRRARDGEVDVADLLASEHLDADVAWVEEILGTKP